MPLCIDLPEILQARVHLGLGGACLRCAIALTEFFCVSVACRITKKRPSAFRPSDQGIRAQLHHTIVKRALFK